MRKISVLIVLMFFFTNSWTQGKFVQSYMYEAKTQSPGQKEKFILYYIVDSSVTYKMNGVNFFRFTFSEDSLSPSGFIGYDKKSSDILYVFDTTGKKKYNIQRVFRLKSMPVKVSHFPFLGSNIVMKQRKLVNSIVFYPVYTFPRDSHSVIIKKFEFELGKLYPKCISFEFPFEKKSEIKICGTL